MDYIALAYELRDLIKNDERYLNLNRIEEEMEHNEEVMALSYQKDLKETHLSDLLKYYSRDSKEVKEALLELYRANNALNEHPLVKTYLEAYETYNSLLKEINNILFHDLVGDNNACHSR